MCLQSSTLVATHHVLQLNQLVLLVEVRVHEALLLAHPAAPPLLEVILSLYLSISISVLSFSRSLRARLWVSWAFFFHLPLLSLSSLSCSVDLVNITNVLISFRPWRPLCWRNANIKENRTWGQDPKRPDWPGDAASRWINERQPCQATYTNASSFCEAQFWVQPVWRWSTYRALSCAASSSPRPVWCATCPARKEFWTTPTPRAIECPSSLSPLCSSTPTESCQCASSSSGTL